MNTSTKPFRRAGQLVVAFFYLMFASAYIAGCKGVARLTGVEFAIDPLESPLLHRTNRILHARDVKKREKELQLQQKQRDLRETKALEAMEDTSRKNVLEKQARHEETMELWDERFDSLRADEIAEENRLKAEAEAARQRIYEANRQKELEEERKQREADKAALEAHYASLQSVSWKPIVEAGGLRAPYSARYDIDTSGYTTRRIDPNMTMNLRTAPNLKARVWGQLIPGLEVSVDGWIYGEPLLHRQTGGYVNIWFRLRHDGPESLFMWSGGLTNASTSGIPNLNPPFDGSITAAKITTGSISAARLQITSTGTTVSNAHGTTATLTSDYLREQMDRLVLLNMDQLLALKTNIRKLWESSSGGDYPTHETVNDMVELVNMHDEVSTEINKRNRSRQKVRSDYGAFHDSFTKQVTPPKAEGSETDFFRPRSQGNIHQASALWSETPPVKGLGWLD